MDASQETQTQNQSGGQEKKDQVLRETSKAITKLKRKPALGVALAGGLGFIVANAIGVGEAAIAMAAGYAAYRVLRT